MGNEFTEVRRGQNKVGTVFAMWRHNATGTFWVWQRCGSYSQHAKDGIAYDWRYIERKLSEDAASKLLDRKLKGKGR